MLRDAIRMVAAALCCDEKKLTFNITPALPHGKVLEFILQLTGYAEVSSAGEVRLKTPVALPRKLILRFRTLPKELFFLFAGVAAKMDVVTFVWDVEGGVSAEELNAISEALDGALVAVKTAKRYALSAWSEDAGFSAQKDFPPAFAAGMLLGASLARRETAFTPGKYAETDEVRWALDALAEFGNPPVFNEDGTVTVHTLRGRYARRTGKRIRKRAKPCS